MTKLKVVIADDERPAREFLKSLLAGIDAVEIVGEADNGADALALIRSVKPDMAFLDLQMPEMTGIDVARSLRADETPLFAFVTAFDEYAIKAFELNAVDYLLKPVEYQRLLSAVERAQERLTTAAWREEEASRLSAAAELYTGADRMVPLRRIPVRKKDDILLVQVEKIVSIVADGELLNIYTSAGERFVINYRLKDLAARLDASRFVRVSRGALVNLDEVDRISPLPGGTYQLNMKNGQVLQSSRTGSRSLREQLLRL